MCCSIEHIIAGTDSGLAIRQIYKVINELSAYSEETSWFLPDASIELHGREAAGSIRAAQSGAPAAGHPSGRQADRRAGGVAPGVGAGAEPASFAGEAAPETPRCVSISRSTCFSSSRMLLASIL